MNVAGRIHDKRAIEALRAGVPNRDAVTALGTAHPEIEERFRTMLADVPAAGAHGENPTGFLVAGDFGTGKSHLLEYLQQIALEEHFVVSKVIISKETPMYDPVKLYRSAIRAATVPGRVGAALHQIASEIEFRSETYAEFSRWVQGPSSGLNQRFASTVFLYEEARQDPELLDKIIGFWSGDPIQVSDIRRALNQLGLRLAYTIERVTQKELAYQRFRFAPRLMQSAGYRGWVLLFDEVDLVGRYTILQRARSYGEIARWTGHLAAANERYPGITSVVAITSAFESEILQGKNDIDGVQGRLRGSTRPDDLALAPLAVRGMQLIGRATHLEPPSEATINATYQQVKQIHADAYGWNPPDVAGTIERLRSTRMREYVRRWINEWDLTRLDPSYSPSTEVTIVTFDVSEDSVYTEPMEDDVPTSADE